ncbi:MAG: uracil-DNA glycosylase [Ghiorsea sp.]|nr:uracil-DNA glycosylase [Ghiorsea sp.]
MKHWLEQPCWQMRLQDTFALPYMQKLEAFLQGEHDAGKIIYPKSEHVFQALNTTAFNQVKVVILGQDPYHGEGQAHGLCFSVPPDIRVPPSLKNIYKELHQDLGVTMPNHGCLQAWAERGVLLLNSVLTVEQGKAASHQNKGWEQFTDKIIALINDEKEHVVFILWGAYAQKKGAFIDASKHLVIHGLHPSPLSAHRGFFGQHYFSQTNIYLEQHGLTTIDWTLPEQEEVCKQLELGGGSLYDIG